MFKVHMLGLYKMKKHSHRHTIHLLVVVLFGFAFLNIFQLMLCLMFLLVSCQMCLLSSVWFVFSLFLNDDLWFAYLSLNGPSLRPMYVAGSFSVVSTVAWYITLLSWQFPFSGQLSFSLQLQFFSGGFVLLLLFF